VTIESPLTTSNRYRLLTVSTTLRTQRVALYGRTSDDESEGRSVDDQLRELRRWADQAGRKVIAELRDDGVSASRYAGRKGRPDWQRAMELITTRQIDELAVWEVSRSTRDRAVWSALVAACVENGVNLAVDGKVHDPADPDDGFMLDLGAALAVREVAMLSKRVRRAVNSRAAAGRPHGSVPFGYRRVINPETGAVEGRELHPQQAPIVAEIVRRLLDREPADAIAADLNRRGVPVPTGNRWLGRQLRPITIRHPEHPVAVEIAERLAAGEQPMRIADDLNRRDVPKPTPTRWRGGNLRILALRPTYAGLRVHHGDVLDGVQATWPPIITEVQHYALVKMFGTPERDKFRNPTHVKHLGVGLYRCGRDGCDGRMRVVVQGGGRPNRYDCRECHKISRHQAPVDALVEAVILARLSQPDALAALYGHDDTAVQEAAREAARLRAKIADARKAWEDDRLSLESFTAMESALRPKIAEAERRARPRELPPAVATTIGADAAQRWAAASIGTRRGVLDALMTVTLLPVGRGGRPFDPESVRIEWKSV
jgi:DNA invertase Pin-like site-specific DNA recombinase